ncbi:S1 RNA-binding domain-containing protein [Salipaludibacillus sp. HK11]|uniref:CvfB family protein n=1 Tax=Salipaludibacillus sp. HK11 TaxID=3394320 RepID=UPI0039FD5E68
MEKLTPGMIENFIVERVIDTGYVLKLDKHEVLLHKNEATEELINGQEVDAFLYEDKKGKIVASMKLPEVTLETYDWVQVVDVVEKLGVFVHIGLPKDILVSADDLPLLPEVWPKRGDHLFVTLDHDRRGKLIAKPVTEEIIDQERDQAPKDMLNETKSGHIYRASKIGSFLITEEGYRGFIHESERKQEPRLGQLVKGRVIAVKDDGTLNMSLKPLILESRDQDAQQLLDEIEKNGGKIPFTDQSTPDEVRERFHLSKAAFKRAMGKLLKENKVVQSNGATHIIDVDKKE